MRGVFNIGGTYKAFAPATVERFLAASATAAAAEGTSGLDA